MGSGSTESRGVSSTQGKSETSWSQKTLADCCWCPSLPHLHEQPCAGGLVWHLVLLAHLLNFWAKPWTCVLCDCALNTSGRGATADFLRRVWHFTMKTCKIHITPFVLLSGHGSLGIAFPLWLHAFSFQLPHCCCQYSKRKESFFDWQMYSTETPQPIKEHN